MDAAKNTHSIIRPADVRSKELLAEFMGIKEPFKSSISIKDVEAFFATNSSVSSALSSDKEKFSNAYLYLGSNQHKSVSQDEYINTCLGIEQSIVKKIVECEDNIAAFKRQTDKLNGKIRDSKAAERLNEYEIMEGSILNLLIAEAEGFFPPDLRTIMDLYVIVKIGTQQIITHPCKTALDPQWDSEFSFDIVTGREQVRIELYDLSSLKNALEAYSELTLDSLSDQLTHDMWLDLKSPRHDPVPGRIHIFAQWIYSRVKYFTDVLSHVEDKIAAEEKLKNVHVAMLKKLQEPYGFLRNFDSKMMTGKDEDYPVVISIKQHQGSVKRASFLLPKIVQPPRRLLMLDNIILSLYMISTIVTNWARTDLINVTVAALGLATNTFIMRKEMDQMVKLGLFTLTFAILFDIAWICIVGGTSVNVKNSLTWITLGLKLAVFFRLKKKLIGAGMLTLLDKRKHMDKNKSESESVESDFIIKDYS